MEPLKKKKMTAVLPEAFRRAAKLNLENARRGFDMLMAASEKAWSDEARPLPSQSGVAALVQEMTRLARSNVDANFDAAQKLIDAEDFERAFRLCVEHMQERLTAFTRQLQEVSSLTPDEAAPTTQTEDHQRQTSRQVRSIGQETTAAAKHQSDDAPAPKKSAVRPRDPVRQHLRPLPTRWTSDRPRPAQPLLGPPHLVSSRRKGPLAKSVRRVAKGKHLATSGIKT